MKKIFFLFLLSLTLLFSGFYIKANTEFCYNLKASVGETYDEVGIIYHSKVQGTVVRYSLHYDFYEYTEVKPEEKVYSKGQTNGEANTVFAERYVCRANLTGLYEDATYYYQVIYGEEKSQIQSFKTANPNKLTFGVLCDTQASGSAFGTSNDLVNKLVSMNSNINFFMIAGDIVDRGGYEEQWNNFEKYMTTLNQQYLQATVPGNHELYHSSAPGYIDATIYNQYYFNPQNGPEQRLNSTYYFMQNDVLFIMLDIMNRSNSSNFVEEQKAWFKEVIQNNPANFVIVMSHPGAYSTGVYDSDAKIVNGNWRTLFEECGVDLAISGHEHIYARTAPLYNNEVDTEKGVTYLIGGSAGQKSYSALGKGMFDVVIETESTGQYSGSICEIVGDTLTLSYYRKDGTLKDTFTIKSKRNIDKNFDMDTFMDSIHIDYDSNSYKSSIVWDNNAYGNVSTIDIILKFNNDYKLSKYVGPNSNTAIIGTTYPTKDYEYEVIVHDYDGNTYSKTLLQDNDETLNEPTNMKLEIIERENEENTYDAVVTYNKNNTSEISLTLYLAKQSITIVDGKATFTSDKNISADIIKLELFYQLFNSGGYAVYTENNMELVIELQEHKHEFIEGVCDCGEIDPNYEPPHEHEFVKGECECGETDPNYEEPEVPNNNGNQAGGMNCAMGFVALLPLIGAATLLLIKRKR